MKTALYNELHVWTFIWHDQFSEREILVFIELDIGMPYWTFLLKRKALNN
jgi:hypothetical protein